MSLINKNIINNFSFLSEKEKELYFKKFKTDINYFYSFVLRYHKLFPDLTQSLYNNVLMHKGILLKSSTAMRNIILNSNDTAFISEYNNWIDLKKELAQLYTTAINDRVKDVRLLEKETNQLEKILVKK